MISRATTIEIYYVLLYQVHLNSGKCDVLDYYVDCSGRRGFKYTY